MYSGSTLNGILQLVVLVTCLKYKEDGKLGYSGSIMEPKVEFAYHGHSVVKVTTHLMKILLLGGYQCL